MSFLTVSGIGKALSDGSPVLNDIGFRLTKNQRIAIAGETGSGKSTLLKIIAGLVQPDRGEVLFDNVKVPGPDDQLVAGHPEIAYLSQHFELPKFLRVEQVLQYANTLNDEEASTIYEICQIDHLLERKTDQLSGGERQRIAIARLLVSSPKLLLLDEPLSHLDMVHKNTLREVIRDIGKHLKITFILVSHEPEDTLSWADKIIVLRDGHIIQQGTPQKIYSSPVDEYVAGLFGRYSIITPEEVASVPVLKKKITTTKNLLLRPEMLSLSTRKTGISGVVTAVRFYGPYYEADVSVGEVILTIAMMESHVAEGDEVNLSINLSKISFL